MPLLLIMSDLLGTFTSSLKVILSSSSHSLEVLVDLMPQKIIPIPFLILNSSTKDLLSLPLSLLIWRWTQSSLLSVILNVKISLDLFESALVIVKILHISSLCLFGIFVNFLASPFSFSNLLNYIKLYLKP